MKITFRPKALNKLDDEIERVLDRMEKESKTTEDYDKLAKALGKLMEAREKKNDRVISNEAIFAAAVNIVSLLIILNFEKTGVITSKAMSIFGKKI